MAKRKYHKGVLETASVLLRMASNDYESMITIANKENKHTPPKRFMARSIQGISFGELSIASLEYIYTVIASDTIDLKYRMIAKSCLYKKLKEDEELFDEEFGGMYDTPEEAMDDFILAEIDTVEPYIASIGKPILVKKIEGKYNEWKRRVGVYEDNERSEEVVNVIQSEVRQKDNEPSDSGSDEQTEIIENW